MKKNEIKIDYWNLILWNLFTEISVIYPDFLISIFPA